MNKKFFTILFTATVTVLAFGQVSMVVKGQVNNVGNLKSQGNVILRATGDPHKAAEIINHGNLVLEGGITFVSSNDSDGLLYNNFTASNPGTVSFPNSATAYNQIKIEKTFTLDDFYYISFPFDIKISDIPKPSNFSQWIFGVDMNAGDFFIWKTSDKRVTTGDPDDQWGQITSASEVLQAGAGYSIYVNSDHAISGTGATLTFPAKDAATVNAMYSNGDKIIPYAYYHDQDGSLHTTTKSWGWGAIGTAHTHTYNVGTASYQVSEDLGGTDFGLQNIYIYSAAGSNWISTPISLANVKVSPYSAMLIQEGIQEENIRKTIASGTPYNFTSLKGHLNYDAPSYFGRSVSNVISNHFQLTFQADNSTLYDQLWVIEGERYVNNFRAGEDALKLFSSKNALSEFYTFTDNEKMAINRFQNINQDIPLGIKLINEANYTINISILSGFENRNIYLLDRQNQITHNLSESEYTFHAGAGTNNDRFVLRVASDLTDINHVTSDIRVWSQNKAIFVQGLQSGDQVAIYDVAGTLLQRNIANNNEVSYPLSQTGIFVVKVNGSNNIVTKVISK